ncbi:MAG: NAD(P)/FAD-dependent oxidoreductase [Pseudomonadota bacterium]
MFLKKRKYDFDAAIIGGGHNGLVCAYYLARSGLKTCVLERHSEVGGAAVTEEFHPGFRNSVASYTVSLLQPKVIADMELARHGLEVVLRETDNFLPTETDYLLAGRDGLTAKEIARHSQADAQALIAYEDALGQIVDYLREFLLVAPPNAGGGLQDVLSLLRTANITRKLSQQTQRNLLAFFTKSAGEILDAYFENDLVKALFGFDAVVGNFASPYEPGSAYVLLHHVFGEANGVREAWGHAVGGMGAITQAMRSACEEQGVTIVTGDEVTAITESENRQYTVKTASRALTTRIIASSVHPKILFEKLLDRDQLPEDFRHRIKQYQSHSGTFRMNLALKGLPNFVRAPEDSEQRRKMMTSGIIIAPSLQYMEDAWISAKAQGWADDPIIEMLIPSTLDESLAPTGQHVASLFCQQFAFDLPNGMNWHQEKEHVADHIIATVDQYAPGFKDLVVGRQIMSPLDLQERFGLIGGDIFHGRMSLDQLFSARPVLGHGAYRSPLKNIYMCGSGTHPGGGVTGAPGHNAANEILRDQRWFRWG